MVRAAYTKKHLVITRIKLIIYTEITNYNPI